MHIPDGYLSAPVWVGLNAVSLPAVAVAARRAHRDFAETRVPLMGMMGAFIFAAQMINFPVAPGVSGHLLGGALLHYTLGAPAAVVVMAAILGVQALFFQDGGLLALGANVFNMAIVGVFAAGLPRRVLAGRGFRTVELFAAGFLSSFVTAALALTQLGLSGLRLAPGVLGVSLAVFAVTATAEGVLNAAVIKALEQINPRFVLPAEPASRPLLGVLAVLAVLLATGGALIASSLPDGLEHLAELTGITSREHVTLPAPFPGYATALVQDPAVSGVLAGLVGTTAVLVFCWMAGTAISRRRRS